MPRLYSNSEYADMVYLYGFCDGNVNAARREYSARFPNRKLPNKFVFSSTFQRLKETVNANQPLVLSSIDVMLVSELEAVILNKIFNN